MLVEQEPLAGIGEDSRGVAVPLDPDILHVVVEQLQPSKVLKLPRLLDILVRQEVLNLRTKMMLGKLCQDLAYRVLQPVGSLLEGALLPQEHLDLHLHHVAACCRHLL